MAERGLKVAASGVGDVFTRFLKLGLTSFGGPAAHLGYFRKEFVERQRWVSESQFGQLLAICQFLPGPASSQLCFALGLLRSGWLGGVAAFLAFTLPSALLLVGFALALPSMASPVGDAAIHGLKLVACAVVADAVLGMSKTLCPDMRRRGIAVLAAGALLFAGSAWTQVGAILGGAIAGVFLCREAALGTHARLRVTYGKPLAFILFTLFLCLLAGLAWVPNDGGILSIASEFYHAGALVFGGGHVVLPLLEDSVVASGLVTHENFLAGYGAAQAIPGPMFTFSAYLGAIIPTAYGVWGTAAVAVLFMFLPGFLLIAAALPVWQTISHNPIAARAIAGVNAAVVGILGAALYDPIFIAGIASGADLIIVAIAFSLLAIWKCSPVWVLAWCLVASVFPVWW